MKTIEFEGNPYYTQEGRDGINTCRLVAKSIKRLRTAIEQAGYSESDFF